MLTEEDAETAVPWQLSPGNGVTGVYLSSARLRATRISGVVIETVDGCAIIGRTAKDRNAKMIDLTRWRDVDVLAESIAAKQVRADAGNAALELAKFLKSKDFTPEAALERIDALRRIFAIGG